MSSAGAPGLSVPAVALNSARLSKNGGETNRTVIVDVLCVRPLAVTVLAGTTEPGFANGALNETHNNLLNFPQGIMQPDANTLLIADRSNDRIRKFDLSTKELSTWAGVGSFNAEEHELDSQKPIGRLQAQLIAPSSICRDPTDETSFIVSSDDVQKVIRSIDSYGQTRIIAGAINGEEPDPEDQDAMTEWVQKCLEPTAAGLSAVFSDIACVLPAKLKGTDEELVYMTCMSSNCIRSYNPRTGEVKLVLGNGTRGSFTEGSLEDPFGLSVDSQGRLLISCLEGYTILRYDPSILDTTKQVECLAGRSGTRWFRDGMGATDSLLGDTAGLTVDPFDTVYFCDYAHGAVRAISPEGYVYTLVCADTAYTEVSFTFSAPFGIVFDRFAYLAGQPRLFVIDFHRLIQIDLDPASFPSMDRPQTTGRRHNLLQNPNLHSLQEELDLVEKSKKLGVEVSSLEMQHQPLDSSRRPKSISKAASKQASTRGLNASVAPVSIPQKSYEAVSMPMPNSTGDNDAPKPPRTSGCSMM